MTSSISIDNSSAKKRLPKKILILLLCTWALPTAAVTMEELDAADRSCDIQQSSIARKTAGTPACDRAKQMREQYRMQQEERARTQRAREYNRSQERIAATPQRVIYTDQIDTPSPAGSGYHWNAPQGRYCDHNAAGLPTTCY